MTAKIDQDLQNKARDAIEAIGDGSALTTQPAFAAALGELVRRVDAALSELGAAVAEAEADTSENRLAAMAFAAAATTAVGVYRNVRAIAQLRLVDLDPTEASELGAIEVERRRMLFTSAFATAPSELARLGRVHIKETLATTVARLAEQPEAMSKSDRKRLADALVAVERAHEVVREESLDDAAIAERLVTARDEIALQTRALLRAAETFLRSERSPLSLDRLLQVSRKRRSAGAVNEPTEPEPAA